MKAAHREVVTYLRSVGAENVRIEAGGKHPRVVFMWQGRERRTAVSGTPSSPFSAIVAIAELRRSLGLLDRQKHVGKRRRSRTRAAKVPCAAPALTALPDWHDGLLAALTPEELELRARQAWRGFWRDCMQSVGAVSVL